VEYNKIKTMEFVPVIGLEVHIQLATQTKLFCSCSVEFNASPNTQVCPVCLGLPGVLPTLNEKAVEFAIKAAIALNANVQKFIKFDRKNYFYPDLPKNYQITQYDIPFATGGEINIKNKKVRINRIHLEEDTAKIVHISPRGRIENASYSLLDFNRSGIPLLEIVTEPDMNSVEEANEFLLLLQNIIKYLEISECSMERGSFRCDANISIKENDKIHEKTELKNINSFKFIRDALNYEINRQIEVLKNGGKVIRETRLYDSKKRETIPMRSKEEIEDYRYFPEPDIPPIIITDEQIERIKSSITELPHDKKNRFMKEYNLSEYDASILISSKELAEYFETCAKLYSNYKNLSNWIIGPFLEMIKKFKVCIFSISPNMFIELLELSDKGKINNIIAKEILETMVIENKSPVEIINRKNISQMNNYDVLLNIVREVIKENRKTVEDYISGKEKAIEYLIGQAMKKTKGMANPKLIKEILKKEVGP
jgi:aspartyl-tRNA(Asn)/glutamyl-tRNA(Gln) amidotransferase subunit B